MKFAINDIVRCINCKAGNCYAKVVAIPGKDTNVVTLKPFKHIWRKLESRMLCDETGYCNFKVFGGILSVDTEELLTI